jgi:hypothetical protein
LGFRWRCARSDAWTGSVSFQGACQGSLPTYGETLHIAVNNAGAGTLTAVDTPGFNRQYSITIPSAPAATAFTSTGTFAYNNGFTTTPVPGRSKSGRRLA